MATLILAFFVMLALLAAMAIGVLAGREPISGSCGGMKALGMDVDCEVCGGDPDKCGPNAHPIARKIESVRTKRIGN